MTEYRPNGQIKHKFLASMLLLIYPSLTANAAGWWNHRSVVAVPTGPAVGTVQNAAPYQVFAAPAPYAAPAPQAYSAPAYAPSYSYAPAYSAAPVYPQVTYSAAPVYTPAPAAATPAAFSAPAPNTYDLQRALIEGLKQMQNSPAAAAAAATGTPQGSDLSKIQEDLKKLTESVNKLASAPAAQSAAPLNSAPQAAAPNYTPVFMGYAYPQAAPAAAAPQAAAPQQPAATGTSMQLVPVQLYRQKSFLGWDKLKPVNAYPYGVR